MSGGAEFFQQRLDSLNQPTPAGDEKDTDGADYAEMESLGYRAAQLLVNQDPMTECGGKADRRGLPNSEIGVGRKYRGVGSRSVHNEQPGLLGGRDGLSIGEVSTILRFVKNGSGNDDFLEYPCKKLKLPEPTERDQRTGIGDDDFSQTPRSPASDPRPGSVLREYSAPRAGR